MMNEIFDSKKTINIVFIRDVNLYLSLQLPQTIDLQVNEV